MGYLLEINESVDKADIKFDYELESKFDLDSCHYEDSNYILFVDGCVLNKHNLMKHSDLSWPERIIELYKKECGLFMNQLKGSFFGVFINKEKNECIIFQDHIGTKKIFHSNLGNSRYIFSNNLNTILERRKELNLENNLNINAAYMLLSYGYLLEDNTICEEVSRSVPGQYICVKNNNLEFVDYFSLNIEEGLFKDENQLIDELDNRFRESVDLQFKKDLEYGFDHVVALSGGLDSRLTSWVGHDLGYTNQLNITFSQSGYLDETIPKKISSDLGHDWIFKSLDNGNHLFNLEETVRDSYGTASYQGLAHGNSLYSILNFESLGLLHSGQLGDVVVGSFLKNRNHKKEEFFQVHVGAMSYGLIQKVNLDTGKLQKKYSDLEIFKMYQRGFQGANSGLSPIYKYSETSSPFYDVDFMKFAFSMPVDLRMRHNIYRKWILSKYPRAGNYIWEKTGVKLSSPTLVVSGRAVTISKLVNKALGYVNKGRRRGYDTQNNMNPIDYWLHQNDKLDQFYSTYFEKNIKLILDQELSEDCIEQFQNGNGNEKAQVLTLLASVKLFF